MIMNNEYFELSPPVFRNTTEQCSQVLLLAPFSSIPKVDFDEIKIGTQARREVIIRNPTKTEIIIDLIISQDMQDRGYNINTSTFNLTPNSQSLFEIKWNPLIFGRWRDTIQVIHVNGRSKFNHILVTSSVFHRLPLRRIHLSNADRFNNVPKVSKAAVKSNSELEANIKIIKKPSKRSFRNDIKPDENKSNNRLIVKPVFPESIENSEHFVVGKLPECNISPIQSDRSTYVKHPGFPTFQHNLPTIVGEGVIDGKVDVETKNICKLRRGDIHLDESNFPKEGGVVNEDNYENSLELSDVQLSPIKKTLTSNKKRVQSTSQIFISDETTKLNMECVKSFNGPLQASEFRPTEEIYAKPLGSPVNNKNKTISYGFTISPCIKLNVSRNDRVKMKKSPTSDDILPYLVSQPPLFTSTTRKKCKPGNTICSISPKSRVEFKKIPKKLFTNSNLSRSVQQNKLLSASLRSLNRTGMFEDSLHLHPLGFYYETSYENPFAKNALHTAAFLEKQTIELVKWLNSILTPPDELSSMETGVDIEKLWKKSITSEILLLAPTKDEVSTKFHSDEGRLMAVRKAAMNLYKSEKVSKVLYGILTKIDIGFLDAKDGLDLHCDQGARYKLVQLIMYYNPLWLRIGLETIYNQKIYMSTKDTIGALMFFIKKNLLSDNQIIKKNTYSKSTSHKMPNFRNEMNNFIVFKFLSLIFFLDQAKTERLIPYDPCLFRKSSLIKESEGILNEFIKEFIKCIGAQRRTLVALGYSLKHKQTCLDEFDFSLTSPLCLRDGVRLARAMEIILKKTHLSQQLRTPAVSRLQKVHNVKVSLEALRQEGYEITEDITANDIVDGHHEKIMSLLWQILHRFLGPRYLRSAIIIQKWWRNILPDVMQKQGVRKKAAVKIQAWWKGIKLRRKLPQIIEEFTRINQNKKELIKHAMKIKIWYKGILVMRREREKFLLLKQSAIKIQRWFRGSIETKRYMAIFVKNRNASILIQKWFRNILLAQKDKENFQALKYSTIFIQRKFRSMRITKEVRKKFISYKLASINIQRWFRGMKRMREDKAKFETIRNALILIQRRYRGLQETRKQRTIFKQKRQAARLIKSWYKGVRLMRTQKKKYHCLKENVILIQRRFRSRQEMKIQRNLFVNKRNACIKIQYWYRNVKVAKEQRKQFIKLKQSVIFIQILYRKKLIIRQACISNKVENACIVIQRWFRLTLTMKRERNRFLAKRYATLELQKWYRSCLQTRRLRTEFVAKRNACILIQRWLKTRRLRAEFIAKRNACILIQRRLKTRRLRTEFMAKRNACILIQRWFRKVILQKECSVIVEEIPHVEEISEQEYKAAVIIQSLWRSYIWRKRNSHIVNDIKKRSEAVKRVIIADNPDSGNQRLVDMFEQSITYFTAKGYELKQFKILWMVVKKLDFITLHSPVLCERLAQNPDFFNIAWSTLDIQTRSDPYIMVFGHILNILMNLARYDKTFAYVHQSLVNYRGHIILAILMGKSLEKHSNMFCKCVCLLWIMSLQNPSLTMVLKSDSEFTKRLFFYYKRIAKKPQKLKKNRIVPQLESDWGYKSVSREFLDEFAAITELLQALNLKLPK